MFLPPKTMIASGPVIIEDGKVLLNREEKEIGSELFMFPGGRVENFSLPLEHTCHKEVMEELGLEIEIIRPLKTLLIPRPGTDDQYVILVHYLARRKNDVDPGERTLEWVWHDIYNLPENCAPNVKPMIDEYIQEEGLA